MRACACTVRVLYEGVCADCVSLCVLVQKKNNKKKTVHSNATATAETDLMEGTDFWRSPEKWHFLPLLELPGIDFDLLCPVLFRRWQFFFFFTAASFIADQLRREGRR